MVDFVFSNIIKKTLVNILFTVRSNARRQPDSTQQRQALLKGAQLGAALPLGERRATGTTDGGGQYQRSQQSQLSDLSFSLLCPPLPPIPLVFDINMSLRGLKQKSHANVMLLFFFFFRLI